jgi:hypothetical protein
MSHGNGKGKQEFKLRCSAAFLFHTVLCEIFLRQNILVRNGKKLIPVLNKLRVYSEYLMDCLLRVKNEIRQDEK